MSEKQYNELAVPTAELSEFILKIPGEHFFCETISLPAKLEGEDELGFNNALKSFVQTILQDTSFSPYPEEQLACGYYGEQNGRRAIIFACPSFKLRQQGWQNLEIFRRVFPSFVSLFGKKFTEPTVIFLQEGETLTIASFEADSSVPDQIFSLPVDLEDSESLKKARGKLLSLVDTSKYEVISDILIAVDVERHKDGNFHFEHEWKEGTDPNLEIEQTVTMSGDDLWMIDLRANDFKSVEITRRRQGRKRWKATLAWTLSMAAILVLFLAVKIMGVKLEDKQLMASEMAKEVPLVIESQKLLEKLRQNKLGGIDPFGAIGRLYEYLGGGPNDLNVFFTYAHFKSRNEIELEGEGKNVEAINTFLEELVKNKVASLQKSRTGKELREIKSQTGKTTFKFDIELIEEEQVAPKTEDANEKSNLSG